MKIISIRLLLCKPLETKILISYSVLMTFLCLNAWIAPNKRGTYCEQSPTEKPSVSSRINTRNNTARLHRSYLSASGSKQEQHTHKPIPMDWTALESTDFATYVANLRASGCPEVTIRRIVAAEVREAFDQDRLALLEKEPIPFWEATYGIEESKSSEFENLAAEETALLYSLLGTNVESHVFDPRQRIPSAWRFGPKLDGKSKAVTSILAQADTKREEILVSLEDAEITPADQAILNQIEAEKVAALEATLTPEERDDFEIRNSEIAHELRELLAAEGRQVNEIQFRAMFQARKTFAAEIEKAAISGTELGVAHASYQASIGTILQQF